MERKIKKPSVCLTISMGINRHREIRIWAQKDTESEVQSEQTSRRELQLVVEQRTVRENSLLDAGLHWTLQHTTHSVRTFRPQCETNLFNI